MAVSKRTRFEILKRHGFRCFYCGASPLQNALTVKLHADHVEPRSKGGEDDPANLVAACGDCNLGKSNIPLDERRFKSSFSSEEEREQADQIREYLAAQRAISEAKRDAAAIILEHWESEMGEPHWQLPRFIPGAVTEFGVERVIDAVDIVSRKGISNQMSQVKYFCGVLRNWRQPKKPAPATNTPDINEAKWGVAISFLESYCRYRWFAEEKPQIGDIVRRAIGETPGKPAAVLLEDMYRAIDNATWLNPDEFVPDSGVELARFKAEIEKAIQGGDIVDETFVTYSIEGFYRAAAEETAKGAKKIWKTLCKTEPNTYAVEIFADIIEAATIGYLFDVITYCGERAPNRTLDEQLYIVRRFVVDDLSGSYWPRHLKIRQWPEWPVSEEAE